VQLISPAASPNVAAQGGSASLLVQLDVVPPAASPTPTPQPPSPQPSSNTSSEDSNRQKQAPAAASLRSIKPAIESVFLNGLQCTRLPLARPPPGPLATDSLALEDCGSAEWPVEATGLLAQLEPGANTSSTVTWSDLSIRGNSKGGRNSSGLEAVNVTAVLAALRQLSCVSQLCCGLQIVPNSVVSTNSSSDTVNGTEPQVKAMDGPEAETLTEVRSEFRLAGSCAPALCGSHQLVVQVTQVLIATLCGVFCMTTDCADGIQPQHPAASYRVVPSQHLPSRCLMYPPEFGVHVLLCPRVCLQLPCPATSPCQLTSPLSHRQCLQLSQVTAETMQQA